ncbi:hypothetical protein SmJEL517_g02490 [Synchytrium microbalum]|uniref:Uncharacterized protein n=1 Tax=Synchytrium microbalum TaxID=1806994 RepID=A0A507C782_9FUNG|nr:uncharacterized protein SmJEL517_g02490 [Synchytrium microbalum]TPX34989.1 hypothetical protein SmJEL517_g02490 [Synchytrium microbalum]
MSSTPSEGALDRGAVVEVLVRTLLNNNNQSPENASSPTGAPTVVLKSGADLIMALIHVIMIKFGCRFVGLGEDGPETSSTSTDATAATADSTQALPVGWNSTGDTYSFRYRHTQSTFTFLIKGVKVANRLVIHGMAIEDGKLLTLELNLLEFISPSFPFPYRSGSNRPLTSGFISETILDDLIARFRTTIAARLLPGQGAKLGYEEPKTHTQTREQQQQGERSRHEPPSRYDPLRIDPPYGQPRFGMPGSGGMMPGMGGFGVGDRDLDPFGAAPGLIPPHGYGGLGGFGGGSGGMVVGPDHPMFAGRGGFRGGPPTGPTPLGPLAIPPGARYDPIGPFGPGPNAPVRPGRGNGRGAPFSGEPDPDEMMPPGYDQMYM